jgi:hypothetical protein
MGAVPVKVVGSFIADGDSCLTYAVYVYCDNCGSFNIEKHVSLRQWLLIIIGCSLAIAIIYSKYALSLELCWPFIFMTTLFIGITIFNFWGFPAFRCRECTKFTTMRYNTRNYPSEDTSIIDMPDQLTQKFGLTGWPVDQPIEAYLRPPKGIAK